MLSSLFCTVESVVAACATFENDHACAAMVKRAVRKSPAFVHFYSKTFVGFRKSSEVEANYWKDAFLTLCYCVSTCTSQGMPIVSDAAVLQCIRDSKVVKRIPATEQINAWIRENSPGLDYFVLEWCDSYPGDEQNKERFSIALKLVICMWAYAADKWRLPVTVEQLT